MLSERQASVALWIILALSFTLRAYELGDESLWNDELTSWLTASQDNWKNLFAAIASDVHPPGYSIVLFGFIHAFGDAEEILRLPSMFAGVASIWVLFLLGRRLYSTEVGLLASALLAVSWSAIYYSQEARAYALLLLFTELSWLLWLNLYWVAANRGKAIFFAYSFIAAFTVYLHYFGFLVIALQAMAALFTKRSLRALVPFGLVAISFLPWASTAIAQVGKSAWRWIPERSFWQILENQHHFLFEGAPWVQTLFLIALVVAAALVVKSIYAITKSKPQANFQTARADVLVAYFAIAPIVIAYVVSVSFEPVITPRNLIVLLPAAYLLVGRAAWSVKPPLLSAGASAILIAALFSGTLFAPGYFDVLKKEQPREVARLVADRNLGIPVIGFSWSSDQWSYYFNRFDANISVTTKLGLAQDRGAMIELVSSLSTDKFWYIATQRNPEPEFLAHLFGKYNLLELHQFKGASARLYSTVKP